MPVCPADWKSLREAPAWSLSAHTVHAKNAGAIPVLCTSKKIENNGDAVLSRASEVDKIVFIGKDELMEQNDFNNQIEQLMLI